MRPELLKGHSIPLPCSKCLGSVLELEYQLNDALDSAPGCGFGAVSTPKGCSLPELLRGVDRQARRELHPRQPKRPRLQGHGPRLSLSDLLAGQGLECPCPERSQRMPSKALPQEREAVGAWKWLARSMSCFLILTTWPRRTTTSWTPSLGRRKPCQTWSIWWRRSAPATRPRLGHRHDFAIASGFQRPYLCEQESHKDERDIEVQGH